MPIEKTKRFLRKRIASPKKFAKESFRTKEVKPGVKIIVACPKGKFSKKTKRCKEALEVQAILRERKTRNNRR